MSGSPDRNQPNRSRSLVIMPALPRRQRARQGIVARSFRKVATNSSLFAGATSSVPRHARSGVATLWGAPGLGKCWGRDARRFKSTIRPIHVPCMCSLPSEVYFGVDLEAASFIGLWKPIGASRANVTFAASDPTRATYLNPSAGSIARKSMCVKLSRRRTTCRLVLAVEFYARSGLGRLLPSYEGIWCNRTG
jgi:hypothetical protein